MNDRIKEILREFGKGCSVAAHSNPADCEECLEAAAAALETEIEQVKAIAGRAIDRWEAMVDDLLQGTQIYDERIAEVNAMRAALTA